MTRILAVALLAIGVALAACAPGLPRPTEVHVAAAREQDPSATLADLERGRSTYAAKCVGCHALRDPVSLNTEAWRHEVDEMQTKQGVRLSPQEKSDILRYLDATTRVANKL